MDTLVTSANSSFASTTGFSIDGLVGWMGDSLLKPFIGGGIAVLYGLRFWIIALVVIGAVVYFAYRGFRFFRH